MVGIGAEVPLVLPFADIDAGPRTATRIRVLGVAV